MESNDKRPNAALINKEWFEAARNVLTGEDLREVLEAAVMYVLYGQDLKTRNVQVRCVFAMIKPALDSDIEKYNERCARNAANARAARERVGASGSQSQRVGAITTTTTTPTTTTTKEETSSLSNTKLEEREKWLVYGYFWSIGSRAVLDELSAFWSYYEALGWKNNKGAVIVNKLAAARMWRRQFETGEPKAGAPVWFKAVQTCPVCDYNVFNAYAGAEKSGDVAIVRLRSSAEFLKKLQEAVPTLQRSLQTIWRVQSIDFKALAG